MATDKMFLDNLDEYVNDENKVVTYKWLSHTLSVHVNQAKQMLYAFVQQQRNEKNNDNISVMYCVIGTEEKEGIKMLRVQIVPEESLDVVKSKFVAISTCHIYSVQRSKLKDTNMLYAADYDLMKDHIYSSNKYSAITCMRAKLRSGDTGRVSASPIVSEAVSAKPTIPAKAPETKKAKGGAIAGMFAKSSVKKSPVKDAAEKTVATTVTTSSTSTSSSTDKNTTNKNKPKQGGVMGMFSKQANKPKAQPPKKEELPKEVSKPSPAAASRLSPPSKTTSKGKKNKKDIDSDEEDPKGKKRRRIQAAWQSSSEEEDDEEEEEVIPPTPPPSPPPVETEPSPPASPPTTPPEDVDDSQCEVIMETVKTGGKKRIRKRKMVSKTTVNDEGFMVTEKVWEEESTDASEAEEPPPKIKQPAAKTTDKKTSKKASPKKQSPSKGSKQSNMMSFFKKK